MSRRCGVVTLTWAFAVMTLALVILTVVLLVKA